MKDLSIYFSHLTRCEEHNKLKIGGSICQHDESGFPEMTEGGIAIIYVPEYRGDKKYAGREIYSESFRRFLSEMNVGLDWNMALYDLGNIEPGKDLNDTYFAVEQVVAELVINKIVPVVVGGSQDLTLSLYRAYEKLEQTINLCCVDHMLDLGSPDQEPHADGFLSSLLQQRPCYLFNYSNIGLQAPFASKAEFELFDKLYFDVCRLGEFNADFKIAEPHLRNSDILSVDFRSIRASELLNVNYISPNGFYADQMCQISKYAGISDKLTSFGIFNYLPEKSPGPTSSLVAQMIWYFIDGVAQRKGDFPIGSKKGYFKFTVHVEDVKGGLIFYKSNKSNRWWMEVPYSPKQGAKYDRHYLVPCDQQDYELAMKNEIPDLWWKTYQKLV
jgi:formiminoglutamase